MMSNEKEKEEVEETSEEDTEEKVSKKKAKKYEARIEELEQKLLETESSLMPRQKVQLGKTNIMKPMPT